MSGGLSLHPREKVLEVRRGRANSRIAPAVGQARLSCERLDEVRWATAARGLGVPPAVRVGPAPAEGEAAAEDHVGAGDLVQTAGLHLGVALEGG